MANSSTKQLKNSKSKVNWQRFKGMRLKYHINISTCGLVLFVHSLFALRAVQGTKLKMSDHPEVRKPLARTQLKLI